MMQQCMSVPLAGILLISFIVGPKFGVAADKPSPQQLAVTKLRRFATNVQFNKDGSVRLVRLSKPNVTDEQLEHLKAFPRLDYLAIVCPQVTDAGIANLADLTNLETLLLSQTSVTDAGLRHLTKLKRLQRLYLSDTKITDTGLVHLAGLTNLHTLSLERTTIGDAGLRHLAKLSKLKTLLLGDTRISDEGLKHLAGFKRLQVLYLTRCPIRGDGLSSLTKLNQLKHLCLSETAVSDQTLAALANLKGVQQIELYRTKVSAKGVAKLRSLLPKTGIHIDPIATATKVGESKQSREPRAVSSPPSNTQAGSGNEEDVLPPIAQRLSSGKQRPDFQRHVIPLLGRLGCNGRACHGSFQGKGGFRLSMFGYDFDEDHKNLRQRIDLDSPEQSLILNKPTSEEEHGGGLRFPPGGWQQKLLRRWIDGGALGVQKNAPRFVRLDVTPAEIVFHKPDETVQLRAVAVWSDGTREDVTPLTRFHSNNESVVEVRPDGRMHARGKGDAYVISFYDNGIASTQVILPVSDRTGSRYPTVPTPTKIDELVVAKLKKLGITPSELCGDEAFLRRVSLDLIGTLPAPVEICEFLADASPDKRVKKIDELLKRPAYVTWWTTRLCDLTGSNAGYLGGTEMAQPVAAQWRAWIERRVRDNVGWDKIAEGIILARSRRPGQTYQNFIAEQSKYTRRQDPADFAAAGNPMPHFWFRSNLALPKDKALAFGYTFLGVRLECAQCHKHPFDQWSKRDFQLFTEFFTRIKAGVAPDAAAMHEEMRGMLGVPLKLNTAALRRQSYLRIAAEGREIPWKEIYIAKPRGKTQPGQLLGGGAIDLAQYEDPRVPLMEWLRNEPNRYFAKAFVNRIWANYFNVGIIQPVDDLNLANPPSNKALLDYLVEGFIAHNYDIAWLHRTIASSRTYQLSWRPNDSNRTDERNFSRAILRRLPAEVAIDAMIQATANDAKLKTVKTEVARRKIGQHPKSFQTRSIDFSLLIFGKPLRTTNCDCERQNEPTLLQALYVRNDKDVLNMLVRSDGWIAQLKKKKVSREQVDDLIRTAYARTLSRSPSERELRDCRQHVLESPDVIDGMHDLMWALLNTQEFITNH